MGPPLTRQKPKFENRDFGFVVSKIVTLQIEAFLPLSVRSMILGCLEYQVVGVLVELYEIYYGVLHMYVVIRTRTSLRASLLSIHRMLLIDSF